MAWVYILECADGSYYTGSTIHLETRISQHDLGEGSAYTRPRRRRPVVLLWSVEFARVEDAFEFEKQVQGWSRAKKQALIAGSVRRPAAVGAGTVSAAPSSAGVTERAQRAPASVDEAG